MPNRLGPGVAFLTVTDYRFFPGTVATVNSIYHHHPEAEVVVVYNENLALTEPQIRLLEGGGARVLGSSRFRGEDRHMGGWELKAYGACDLAGQYDMIIGIDSDCVLCADVADVAERTRATGGFAGGRDGEGLAYDASYEVYGIAPGSFNPKYMSSSLYFCPTTPANRAVLDRWAEYTNRADYNGRGPFVGYSDQGVLNAILYAAGRSDDIEMLANPLWSQHWCYWDDVVVYEGGRFLNHTRGCLPQRSFHCGGTEKFWEPNHARRIRASCPAQAMNYAWWLYLLWFGRCRDWSTDPAMYIPVESLHVCNDLVNLFAQIRKFAPGLTLYGPDSAGLLARLVADVRGCMNFGASMEDYIDIVRTVPDGAKVVEVGSCEGRSIVSLALGCLDRDMTFYSVESFAGDHNGTFDGYPLPSIDRYLENIRTRFPFLPINPVFERSEHACALFADGSLDAVFIDACHAEEAVERDIRCWLPKLKPRGILFGDDWGWESVRNGVFRVFEPDAVESSRGGYLWVVKAGRLGPAATRDHPAESACIAGPDRRQSSSIQGKR